MKLEQQVTSLVISKRLKELEVPQGGVFYWEKNHRGLFDIVTAQDLAEDIKRNRGLLPTDLYCSAFTVAELGEMLPNSIQYCNSAETIELWFETLKNNTGNWMVSYDSDDDGHDCSVCVAFHDDTEADARGKMLIYLLENKLIENA